MAFDPRAIHIYTDGSCYKNPGGNAGCAAIVMYPDHLQRPDEQITDFGCAESSNQRMELLACISALKWIRTNRPWHGVTRAIIVTDSRYVHDNLWRAVGRVARLFNFDFVVYSRNCGCPVLAIFARAGTTLSTRSAFDLKRPDPQRNLPQKTEDGRDISPFSQARSAITLHCDPSHCNSQCSKQTLTKAVAVRGQIRRLGLTPCESRFCP
jgi:hypothetical protein